VLDETSNRELVEMSLELAKMSNRELVVERDWGTRWAIESLSRLAFVLDEASNRELVEVFGSVARRLKVSNRELVETGLVPDEASNRGLVDRPFPLLLRRATGSLPSTARKTCWGFALLRKKSSQSEVGDCFPLRLSQVPVGGLGE